VRIFRYLILGMALALLAPAGFGTADEPKKEDKKDEKKKDEPKKENPHDALLNKPAPDIDCEFCFNGAPTKISELKGSVVVLDFWAVWCGPCVGSIPHLVEWNGKYKDKGLEIVGVTSYFERFNFDKAEGKVGQAEAALSKAEEQTMLGEFLVYHKMEYRATMLPKEAWQNASGAYKVNGIPQYVIIDKKGNVRKVVVGGGEKNAKEIEETIKTLLAEK